MSRNVFLILTVCSLLLHLGGSINAQQANPPVWTDTEYPDYIRRITHFGERADWSHDGKKILFLGRTFGDVYEIEIETGIITPVTHHYYHGGYTRALYLSNGDILLSGPRQFNPEEAFGINVTTGKLVNYSQTVHAHEEPEGIFPDGRYTLIESDRESSMGKWANNVDLYSLNLDGSGEATRVTFFAESGRFKGTNPVVSDDGRFIAFQVPASNLEAGVGEGLYIYDIEKAKKAGVKAWAE